MMMRVRRKGRRCGRLLVIPFALYRYNPVVCILYLRPALLARVCYALPFSDRPHLKLLR